MRIIFERWGALIIAALALIQPWLISIWKKYISHGRVEFYETGNLEIGYSGFGPNIGMNGTLRAINKDTFIKSIKLEVTKAKDSSLHRFEWGVFRNEKFTYTGENQATYELPSGFMLAPSSPKKINIQFHDSQIKNEIHGDLRKVSDAWARLVVDYHEGSVGKAIESVKSNDQESIPILYNKF